MGRVLAEPYEIAGHMLPAGTQARAAIILLTRTRRGVPATPTRSAPSASSATTRPSGYEWLPFGGGTRRCLGASFALFEMRVVVRTILRAARLEADRREDEGVVRSNVVLAPNRGARVVRRR